MKGDFGNLSLKKRHQDEENKVWGFEKKNLLLYQEKRHEREEPKKDISSENIYKQKAKIEITINRIKRIFWEEFNKSSF